MEKVKIKFVPVVKSEFFSELREKVDHYFEINKLSKYGDFRMHLKAFVMFSLYIIPYILMITGVIASFWGVAACWALIGLGKAGVGMGVMHDANHRTWSKNPVINKWMGKSLFLLGGFPANWQYQHNTMHHGFTNIDGYDEDIDPGPVMRISPHKPLLKIHKYQHIYAWFLYGLMTFSWVTTKDYAQLKRYEKEGIKLSGSRTYKQLYKDLLLAKILYYTAFIIVPLFVLPFAWYWIIVFFLIMHFISGFILTTVFQTAHVVTTTDFPLPDKTGNIENDWAVHQLATTSDFSSGNKILSWFIGGLDYQVEHHLFPNISHIHYPRISKIVRSMAEKYGLPYHVQPGFLHAVIEHGKMLKHLGREGISTS